MTVAELIAAREALPDDAKRKPAILRERQESHLPDRAVEFVDYDLRVVTLR